MSKYAVSVVITTLLCMDCCFAQNTQNTFFLQPSVVNLLYNSGFAGSANAPRLNIAGNVSSQFYRNSFVSYDQYFHALRSGVGLVAEYNQYNDKQVQFNTYKIGFCIAPKFTINDSITLSPSVGISYNNINQRDKVGDSTTTTTTSVFDSLSKQTIYSNYSFQKSMPEINIGLLLNTRKYHVGVSVRNFTNKITEPAFYLVSTVLTGNAGGKVLSLGKLSVVAAGLVQYGNTTQLNKSESKADHIVLERKWQLLNLQANINARYGFLLAGGGVNSYNWFGLIGFQDKTIKVLYALGVPNHITPADNNLTHEISISYIFH